MVDLKCGVTQSVVIVLNVHPREQIMCRYPFFGVIV